MKENRYTPADLHAMQSWSLERKIQVAHPKQYDFRMKSVSDGGLGLAEVLDYIGVEH